jgi:hypothetical protein
MLLRALNKLLEIKVRTQKFMGKMEKFVLVIAMAMTLVRLKIKNKLIALYWMILRQTSSCSL